jgi:hypothetical protein
VARGRKGLPLAAVRSEAIGPSRPISHFDLTSAFRGKAEDSLEGEPRCDGQARNILYRRLHLRGPRFG